MKKGGWSNRSKRTKREQKQVCRGIKKRKEEVEEQVEVRKRRKKDADAARAG